MLKTGIRKYDIFKTYYYEDATLVGKYKLPKIESTQFIPKDVISFNEKKQLKLNDDRWLDFFIDDALFECFWKNADKYEKVIKRAKGIITTDFSLYPELLPGNRIWNVTRNRILAYHMQAHMKLNIIPVASWCNKDDFDWCFDGLPKKASIAISSNGCKSSPYGMRMLLEGIDAMQQILKPTHIIVCGKPIDELKQYKNIHYYKSFSERWKERCK